MSRCILLAALALAACGSPRTEPTPVSSPPPLVDAGAAAAVSTADAAPPPMPPPMPWSASGIDWSRPPAPGPEPGFVPPSPQRMRLGNGVELIVVPRRRLPLVSIRVINDQAGSLFDPGGRAGLAALTADLLDEGAGSRDTTELARHLETLGAKLRVFADSDGATVAMDTLASTLPQSLELLADVIARPRLGAPDFDRIKKRRLDIIVRRRDRPTAVARLIFDRLVFGVHPYGTPIEGNADSVARVELADVSRFYRQRWRPDALTVVVAGDVEPRRLRRAMQKTLGAWRKTRRRHRLGPPPGRTKRPPMVVVDRPGATQSAVRIGRIALTRKRREYFAAALVNHALGGSFASRMNNRLREQLGYTYGAFTTLWTGRRAGAWYLRTSLHTDKTADGIREALAQIEAVVKSPLPAAELDKARQMLIRQQPQAFETNGQTANSFAELSRLGLPLDWHAKLPGNLRKVTAAQAHRYARSNWTRDQLLVVVVGDLEKILPGLRSLGFGAILQVDPEGKMIRIHGD